MNGETVTCSRWGRARFGGGTGALLGAALLVGVAISALLGWLLTWASGGEQPILAFLVMSIVTLPASVTLGWAILVNRSSLAGAVKSPEESVEATWYSKAASGAFGDLLMVGGLGTAGFAVLRLESPISLVLLAVILFAMADFAARYLWQKQLAS